MKPLIMVRRGQNYRKIFLKFYVGLYLEIGPVNYVLSPFLSHHNANHIYTVHDFPLARIIQSIREDKSELFTNPALFCINFN